MKLTSAAVALLTALGVVSCATQAGLPARMQSDGDVVMAEDLKTPIDKIIASWPARTRQAAESLMAKHGIPNMSGDRMLVWYDRGPFVRIALSREEQRHDFPVQHMDFLTMTVRYVVPVDRVSHLSRYNGSVSYHRTRGELSAQCNMEAMNFLALNLAVEVADNRRTAERARDVHAELAAAFEQGKRTSPYVNGLMFQPSGTGDPDAPHR